MRVDARAAARNNAYWCDAVCRAHGLAPTVVGDVWSCARRTPPFYPDAVTLAPRVDASTVLGPIDATPGCSVKDSFADLDLAAAGFTVLFDARWIAFPPPERAATTWSRRAAGAAGAPDDPRVTAFAASDGSAGAIAFRRGGVVGISNLAAGDGELVAAWHDCLAAVAATFPGEPVVGYEHGDALAAALDAGASTVGALRVWEM